MKHFSPRRMATALLLLLLLFASSSDSRAQALAAMNAAETEDALHRLGVAGSVLYVGAHPDDENTALLAYLARGRGVRTAYLSVTRGDGGQNLIGTEKGELLGLVRTQELLAARGIDGAEQLFTRAVDFGFTKSPEETLRIWNHDAVLGDVVWVIRRFRPDVIISRFPTTGEGGHGQHTASAILAREAFDAAADPARFPEQLKHVTPWKPKRLLWNAFVRQGEQPANAGQLLSVDVGAYNPLLGKSYTELAAQSRTMHKSQGMGATERRGSSLNYLAHIAGEAATKDIFDGIDLTWRRFAGGEMVGQLIEQAAREFRPSNPEGVLPLLLRARREMDKLPKGEPLVDAKRAALLEAIRACAGLWLEATTPEPFVTPRSEVKVSATLINRSDFPLRLVGFGLDSAKAVDASAELKNNQPVTRQLSLSAPADYSQPYWLRDEPGRGLFAVEDRALIGIPENAPPLAATVVIAAGDDGEKLNFEVPVVYRWTDRVRGDLSRPVAVVPEVAVHLEEKTLVFPDRQPKPVRVKLRSNIAGDVSGTLRLKLPAGWTVAPAQIPVALKTKGEEFSAAFNLTPPAEASTATLAAEFVAHGKTYTRGLLEIDYPHIPPQTIFPVAEARAVRVDLARRGNRIGYVMGAGDEIPDALRQVGYDVTLLSDSDLEGANFDKFDAIVTGVRAYNTRAALRRTQSRLLDYVERGGTLVVQYNTPERALEDVRLGPYPFRLARDARVTVEEAPVALLAPGDPLLNAPNKITAADFENWVQERGLYFAAEWDARYTPLFESHDPGEKELRGGTLVARHGKGVYVFTAYAFFRQLPAGVPGAYRLFVNMLSAGRK